jgi:hypothetical protein
MQDRMLIPFHEDYTKIWKDYKISFFNSFSSKKWKEELIDINSVTYEFIKDEVEELFYKTGGYTKYLDFESIYRLSIETTASQVIKNLKKQKNCFFEKENINNIDKYYLIKQRICNNCKNVFDSKRKVNVISLETMIIDSIYENYEIEFTIGDDIQKIAVKEPSKLIFAINKLLNNYDLEYEELIEITQKYNIDSSSLYILNFANQFRNLKKESNNQIVIDFHMEVA